MKIAQIAPLTSPVAPDSSHDVGRIIYYLTEELLRLGYQVTLFATANSQTTAVLVPSNPQPITAHLLRKLIPRHFLTMEKAFQREAEFDIIHSHMGFLIGPLVRRHAIPTLTTIHQLLTAKSEPLYREYEKLPLVALTEWQKQQSFAWLNWKAVISPGVVATNYPFQTKRGNYIAYYGDITPTSGVATAIDIAIQSGWKLKIGLDRSMKFDIMYFAELESLFEHPLVSYVGKMRSEKQAVFLSHAAALILPEGDVTNPFSLIPIETLAYGTPLIAAQQNHHRGLVVDGENGYIYQTVTEAVACLQKNQ